MEDEGTNFARKLETAKQAAATIRARSTTQHTDIRDTPPPPLDASSDDDEADAHEAPSPAQTAHVAPEAERHPQKTRG